MLVQIQNQLRIQTSELQTDNVCSTSTALKLINSHHYESNNVGQATVTSFKWHHTQLQLICPMKEYHTSGKKHISRISRKTSFVGPNKVSFPASYFILFFYSFWTLHMKYYSIIIVTDPYTHNKQTQDQSTQIQHHVLHFPNRFSLHYRPVWTRETAGVGGNLGNQPCGLPWDIILYKPRATTWSRPCFHHPCSLDGTREDGPTGRQIGRGIRNIRDNVCEPPPTVLIQMMMSLKLTSALINSLMHPASTVKMH